jgi:hypothetical protein
MQSSIGSVANDRIETSDRDARPVYERPSIRVLDEKDVLSAFQVTVSGITWWVM